VSSRTSASVLASSVEFAKSTDPNRLAEVDVAGYGRGTDVEPVGVVGGEFFEGCSFDNVNPSGDLEFAFTTILVHELGNGRVGDGYRIVSRIGRMLC